MQLAVLERLPLPGGRVHIPLGPRGDLHHQDRRLRRLRLSIVAPLQERHPETDTITATAKTASPNSLHRSPFIPANQYRTRNHPRPRNQSFRQDPPLRVGWHFDDWTVGTSSKIDGSRRSRASSGRSRTGWSALQECCLARRRDRKLVDIGELVPDSIPDRIRTTVQRSISLSMSQMAIGTNPHESRDIVQRRLRCAIRRIPGTEGSRTCGTS